MEELLKKLLETEHGFKPFQQEAKNIVDTHSVAESKRIAIDLLHSEFYQIRSCAIFMLGMVAERDITVLSLLKDCARTDASWQVQEIVAKAFDQFCSDRGYEESLPEIEEWFGDTHPNVCRAVTEGLRVWTGRPYFKDHPDKAIQLISMHKASESEYLRKSVGNSLRDIRKKHEKLVEKELATWDLSDRKIAFTYKYALKKQ